MTTANPASGLDASEQNSRAYSAALRMARWYAVVSPTFAALLMTKKTRAGRFVPLPDALPDDFNLGKVFPFMLLSRISKQEDDAEAVEVPNQNGKSASAKAITLANPTATKPVDYEIIHQLPGRIRLRVPRLGYDNDYAQRLAQAVMTVPEVSRVRVNRQSTSLLVHYDSPDAAVSSANGSGRKAEFDILPHLERCMQRAASDSAAQKPIPKADFVDDGIPYGRRLGLPVLGLGLGAGVLAGLTLPVWLVGGTILVSAMPIFRRTVQGIRDEKRLTVDFLDATSIVLFTMQASFLSPAIIIGVIESSEVARDWTRRRNRQASLDLLMAHERQALVVRNDEEIRIAWRDIVPGDIVLVYPGEEIPVDGIVREGHGLVEEHRVTGDARPSERAVGDQVHAATMLLQGYLRIETERTGYDTHLGAAIAHVETAPAEDTRVSNHARKVGNWAVMPTLAVGAATGALSGDLARATGIINMDLGTGMRVSAPIAILTAQTSAARRGILIRSGQALEALTEIDTIVFDKTATLTSGRAAVTHIETFDAAIPPQEVLALAASAEQGLHHPIGAAIVNHARAQGVAQRPVTDWDYVAGQGVVAQIGGKTIRAGSAQLMQQAGIEIAGKNGQSDLDASAYVSGDGELLGLISCTDPVRPESAEVIAALHALNIETSILSGDRESEVQAVASAVGIAPERVHAQLLPTQKLELVQALKAAGRRVAFVGDGINDAAAMAHADVSIAMGSATDLARETADIVLTKDDLRDLLAAREISLHAMRIIAQNKALVTIPNLGGIAYSVLTVANPLAGMVINNGSALAAALNSLRSAPGSEPKLPSSQTEKVEKI